MQRFLTYEVKHVVLSLSRRDGMKYKTKLLHRTQSSTLCHYIVYIRSVIYIAWPSLSCHLDLNKQIRKILRLNHYCSDYYVSGIACLAFQDTKIHQAHIVKDWPFWQAM